MEGASYRMFLGIPTVFPKANRDGYLEDKSVAQTRV